MVPLYRYNLYGAVISKAAEEMRKPEVSHRRCPHYGYPFAPSEPCVLKGVGTNANTTGFSEDIARADMWWCLRHVVQVSCVCVHRQGMHLHTSATQGVAARNSQADERGCHKVS